MNIKVLGFDISSSCIGWCLLEIDENKNIHLIKMSYLIPLKKDKATLLERIIDTRDKIKKIIEEYKPHYIGVEDLIKFMPKSTATTVVMLTTFNRMICLVACDYLQSLSVCSDYSYPNYPELFNVMTIRHGLKINKILPKKDEMPELVAKHLGIIFPYEKNKKNKIKIENYDMADGVAVALYYAFMITGRIKTKVKKSKKV